MEGIEESWGTPFGTGKRICNKLDVQDFSLFYLSHYITLSFPLSFSLSAVTSEHWIQREKIASLAAALGPLACLASALGPLACLDAALGPLAWLT